MVIIGRILVFFGLAAILHAGYSAVQCKYTIHLRWATYKVKTWKMLTNVKLHFGYKVIPFKLRILCKILLLFIM